jgi:hypothetical protein
MIAIAILTGYMLHAAEVVHLRDEGVDAFFPKSDGCIVSTYQVNVNASTIKVPSEPAQQQSFATLAIGRYNVCTGTQFMSAFGGVPVTAEFRMAPDLRSAIARLNCAPDQSAGILNTLSLP